jgi:hypothetical protein
MCYRDTYSPWSPFHHTYLLNKPFLKLSFRCSSTVIELLLYCQYCPFCATKRHGCVLKWHPIPYIVHYFWLEPYGPWHPIPYIVHYFWLEPYGPWRPIPYIVHYFWPASIGLWLKVHLHLHLSHLADALIQSDLQIGAFTLWHPVGQSLNNSASKT